MIDRYDECPFEDGGHLLFGHGDDVERIISTFLDHEIDRSHVPEIPVREYLIYHSLYLRTVVLVDTLDTRLETR